MINLKDLLNSGKHGYLNTNNISIPDDIRISYNTIIPRETIQSSTIEKINNTINTNTNQQPPGNNPPMLSGGDVKNFLSSIVSKTLSKNGMLRYFYNQLYNKVFMPDVNGYTLVYMVPPHLSGYVKTDPITQQSGFFRDISKMSVFLALDASPPDSSVSFEEISGTSTSVVFATETRVSKQISITYIDNINISMYSLHKIWVDYIRDLIIGQIEPDDQYIKDDFVELDYVSTFYFIKFKPTLDGDFFKTITFLGKVVGAFPINLPDKEILGRRDANELTIVPITYACSEYRQYVINESANPTNTNFFWVLYDFITDVKDLYGIDTDIQIPQMNEPQNQLNTEIKLTPKQEPPPKDTGEKITSPEPENENPIQQPPKTNVTPSFPTGIDLTPKKGVNSPYPGEKGDYGGTFAPVESIAQLAKSEGFRITARKEEGHSPNSAHKPGNENAYAIDIGLRDKTKEQSDALALKILRAMTGDPNLQLNSNSIYEGYNDKSGKYYSTIKIGPDGKQYEYTMFYSGKKDGIGSSDPFHHNHIHFHVRTPPIIRSPVTS